MKTKQISRFLHVLLIVALLIAQACNASRSVKGGAIGAAAGGAVGGAIGSKKGNTAAGVIIGAAVGGAAGALIGRYMDKQAKEMEEVKGVEVERVGEGILLTFDSGLLFNFDSYQLTAATKENLKKMAEIVKKYDDTEILIEGHTDSVGSDSYNMTLSKNRAQSVADYLAAQGVAKNRLKTKGYGESRPVATNDSDSGRQQNRRVEAAIYANEELKKDAKDGDIGMN
ncbi:MAG: OmpA family protein [Saprospiraceae bacterium]